MEGFDAHTVTAVGSVRDYFDLARVGVRERSAAKFVVSDMLEDSEVFWLNSNFYNLHDEWYWFLLLNGQRVPGSDTDPVSELGRDFVTVEEVYHWAAAMPRDELPLDLEWRNEQDSERRLYSPEFYQQAVRSNQRGLGVGSLLHFPATPSGQARWLLALEYTDDVSPAEVALFFERLTPSLPEEIVAKLEWVVRSPQQETTAQEMEADQLPFHDRIVRYGELVPVGEVAVYNEGIAAGRLLLVDEGVAELSDAVQTDILLVDNVPDWLPPASALISSGLQTPLAHVNLLARNRGIPNASQAGILSDAGIRQAARVRAPAIVRASGTGELEIVLITEDQYDQWRSLNSKDPIAVPEVDADSLVYVMNLNELARSVSSEDDIAPLRPAIGGKSAGFLTLLSAEGVTTPGDPLAITVRPYLEHLALLQGELDVMLGNPRFKSSARTRFLLLEGPKDYAEFYTSTGDAAFASKFALDNPPNTLIGSILEAGGFKKLFRDTPMDGETVDLITVVLEETYGDYVPTQGLRFRSSSSVEDIEGFSGAGLYDSNTGFLIPEVQEKEKDQKKSVEYTLKKTWASYWSFEAFEERRLENVDHLSGAMAVLVHARFDDPLEINNGVATYTIFPEDPSYQASGLAPVDSSRAIVRINVQAGDISVSNPDGTYLPEVIEIRVAGDGSLEIVRLGESTVVDSDLVESAQIGDGPVLDDTAVAELIAQLGSVAHLWRSQTNASLSGPQQIQTITLDFEFKTMAEGWPTYADGALAPERLVVKQARSLDPGLRGVPAEVLSLAVPRDILARASAVERVGCEAAESGAEAIVWHEIYTDPFRLPDLGFSEIPFVDGDPPDSDDGCVHTTLLSTADRFLVDLLDA